MKYLLTILVACVVGSSVRAQSELPHCLPRPPQRPASAIRAAAAAAALPTDPHSRLSRELQQLYRFAEGAGSAARGTLPAAAALREAFPQLVLRGENGPPLVLVRVTARQVAALRPLLEARGFVTVTERAALHFIEGELPVSQLAPGARGIGALAAQGMLGVRAVKEPLTNTGRIESQADYGLQATRVRAAQPTGYDGSGYRIGVLSDSYNNLNGAAAGIASGDLPATVLVLQDRTTGKGTDEGRAMIELLHDLAPGASKAFSAVFRGEGDFANQVLRLADPAVGNCKIIVDDVAYLEEPVFQDGVVAQAINDVTNRLGVAYFGSAGNQADASSEYVGPDFVPLGGAGSAADLNFNPAGPADTRQAIRVPKGKHLLLTLQWSDPFYTTAGVKTDLDVYLIKARAAAASQQGDTVARSNDDNLASQTPVETLSYTAAAADTLFDLVISRRAGTANPVRVKDIFYGDNILPSEYLTHSSTVAGHHTALGNIAVAASPSYSRLAVESFTSKGGPTILFNPDGSPLAAPTVRAKPDFSAIDGVSNTFFGQQFPNHDPNDGFLFFGTSAAAPNAAAVAALLRQANPGMTPADLNARLQSTARDINTPGYDYFAGAGLINAYDAIFGPQVAAAAPFTETFDSPGLSRAWELQGNSNGRLLVRGDLGPVSPPGQLVMDAILPYTSLRASPRRAEATLRLSLGTAPVGGWTLTFQQKKFVGETDNVMPATFTNRTNADGVALSVDGGTVWYSLVPLTGTAASTSYQAVLVNLSNFAQGNGLTLGADVRIRFQTFTSGQADTFNPTLYSGGRAFDDVTVAGALLATRARTDLPNLRVYPSPVGSGAPLTLELPAAKGIATVRVLDAQGRVCILTRPELSPAASTRQVLAAPLAAGLYTVLCQTAEGQLGSRRFVVE